MQRLTDLFRAAARPTSAAPPRSCSRCCSSRCSASPPSPSTSARSTPSGPGSRSAADAAAIAVAQDCSRGNCGDMLATAQAMVTANDGEGTAAQPVLSSDPLSVTVTGSTPVEHWFAPVIGHDSTAVSATRDRRLGRPERAAPPSLPLTFSWCAFEPADRRRPAVGHRRPHDLLTKTSSTTGCTGPSSNVVPGGFGFLKTDPGKLRGHQPGSAGSWTSDTGNSAARRPARPADFAQLGRPDRPAADLRRVRRHRQQRLVPRLRLRRVQADRLLTSAASTSTSPKPCNGNDRCVTGYFTRFVELVRRLDLQPRRPAARGLHPPTDPIRGADS